MPKRVVVIASGETDRMALRELLREILKGGIELVDVLKPPHHRMLSLDLLRKLIISEWYRRPDASPDKFVVLIDTNGRSHEGWKAQFQEISLQLPKVRASVLLACADRHLEAWFFGDAAGLRNYLGRDLGRVDTSTPDRMENPKQHLMNLLGPQRPYTARISGEIARSLSPSAIRSRSPSFKTFESAVLNGTGAAP